MSIGKFQSSASTCFKSIVILFYCENKGLVLYWFGHAPIERLDDGHGDVIIRGWTVPNEFMMPTGDVARIGGWTNSCLIDDP